jgi:uncharacterized protein (DUF1015 family)
LPTLRPFAGLRYDPRVVPDLAAVVCPPYDIIADAERARLAAREPRNAVHVELPAAVSAGDAASDAYVAAGERFAAWRRTGVLVRDDAPSVYVYEQRYLPTGGRPPFVARGVYCALRLAPLNDADGGVRRHERTMAGPKEDRLRLLRAVRANLSPVLLLYDDGAGGARSAELLGGLSATPPTAAAIDDAGTEHRLWRVAAGDGAVDELLDIGGRRPLTIADGHHRYETALRYRDEPGAPAQAGWVMALLYDAASGGLSILPTHRLLHGVGAGDSLLDALDEWFTRDPLPTGAQVADAVAERGPGTLGIWTAAGGGLLVPRRERVAALLPAASDELRRLDVSVLDAALQRILGRDAGVLAQDGALGYTKDAADGLSQVADGRADALIVLASTPVEAVIAVAARGELMPPKSTYFVPKAATGLVFNPLD